MQALRAAERIKKDGHLDQWLRKRYASYDSGIGAVCSLYSRVVA
jgi:xylose isomerase